MAYPPENYGRQPDYGYHHYPPPRVVPTSGLDTASLVCGLLGLFGGWCLFGIPCLAAVALGHMATSETKTGRKAGHGNAIAGLILGYICVVPMALAGVWIVIGLAASTPITP